MRKMMKWIAIVVVAAVVVVGGGVLLAQNGMKNPVSDAVGGVTYGAANAALDATGIKTRVDSALRDNVDQIAAQTGLPEAVVSGMVDQLDIPSWKVAPVPQDAAETGTTDIEYGGYSAEITTYDDPSIVTVQTDAGAITLEVPENVQDYIGYLNALQ